MRSVPIRPAFRSFRTRLSATLLGVVLAGGIAPQAAQAQFWDGWGGGGGGFWGGGGLGPGEISQSVASQGFRVVAPIRRRGAVFVADVIDRRGRRERLIVAAADGQIVQRFLLDDARPPVYAGRPERALPADPYAQPGDQADRGDLVPPADIPNAGTGRGYGTPRYQAPGTADRSQDAPASEGQDGDVVQPARPARPPLKIVKPQKPRVVERSPEKLESDKPVARKPLDAPAPPVATGPQKAPNGPAVSSTGSVATAPAPAATVPPAPATTTRLRDPLAIPGGADKPTQASPATGSGTTARVIPGVTGAPAGAPKPADAPAKPAGEAGKTVKAPADVPVAPLD